MSDFKKELKDAPAVVFKNPFPSIPVDCTTASKGVWLVKVPKYLASKWKAAPDNVEVGRIRITSTQGQAQKQVTFHLNHQVAAIKDPENGDTTVPTEHKFDMAPLGDQTIYVLKQAEEANKETLSVIGKVMQRAECTPKQDDPSYINLKRKVSSKYYTHDVKIKTLDSTVVNNFMPKVHHVHAETKAQPKKVRKDKDKVQDILFTAYTKHQYYNIRDLERLTEQPVGYLKEILHEICRVVSKGPHKNTWELKPEFKTKQEGVEDANSEKMD